jgi:H+/Cl- antiporter ClcA/CBS domain-containing protein
MEMPMAKREVESASTTEGLPVSVSLEPSLRTAEVPQEVALVDGRVVWLSALGIGVALAAVGAAEGLIRLIWLVTNLSFYGRWSLAYASPAGNRLGVWVMGVPILGGMVVGLMARYGSQAIRGHGIPEAMEQVLANQSRIAPRLTFLKPLSAAVAIGTGGPFGAEGPIIATGGALGSLVGQVLHTTAQERKTLLAAGAAAGMAATFGSPVAALLLAVELLLFEYRPRSLIPVALAAATAAAGRMVFHGAGPVFAMPNLVQPSMPAMACYLGLGALVGVASVVVTKLVYGIEDLFDRLPIHWMWWPALGAVAVGVIGFFVPRTLGVGYDNITDILGHNLTLKVIVALALWKLISWSIALGSGTSGGTLAPLFTIGGGLGLALGAAGAAVFPHAGIDVRVAALVGMAAIFAGASRAMLASVVFAFETTLQPLGLLPLLGGCSAAFLISCLMMRHSIMTEKIARRGIRAPAEYAADALGQVLVRQVMAQNPVTLRAHDTLAQARQWLNSGAAGTAHQGYPLLDAQGHLVGVLTRRDLLAGPQQPEQRLHELIHRPPVVVYDDSTLREAADHMGKHEVGRLPVIARDHPSQLVGMVTRSDVLLGLRTCPRAGRPGVSVRAAGLGPASGRGSGTGRGAEQA